jgi:hypothetical protein
VRDVSAGDATKKVAGRRSRNARPLGTGWNVQGAAAVRRARDVQAQAKRCAALAERDADPSGKTVTAVPKRNVRGKVTRAQPLVEKILAARDARPPEHPPGERFISRRKPGRLTMNEFKLRPSTSAAAIRERRRLDCRLENELSAHKGEQARRLAHLRDEREEDIDE